MSHTLIVYQSINNDDEPTCLYLIPNEVISERFRGWMEEAHNKLINCDETNDGMSFLNAATSPNKKDVEGKWADCASIFHEYKMNLEKPWANVELHIDHIYVSGFVC